MNDELNLKFDEDSDAQAVAGALREAYAETPLPQRSGELRDAVEAELRRQKPQPAPERRMTSGKGKPTGLFVLTVSLSIVALVVTLLWQTSAQQQQQLAKLGDAMGNLDQSYSAPAGLTYQLSAQGVADADGDGVGTASPRCLGIVRGW